MSELERGLQQEGLLDQVRLAAQEAGMSIVEWLRSVAFTQSFAQKRDSNDVPGSAMQAAKRVANMSLEEFNHELAEMSETCPWRDLSVEEAKELW